MNPSRCLPHVIRPLPEWMRSNDVIAWQNIGIPERLKKPFESPPRSHWLCAGITKFSHRECGCWGSYELDGRRYCFHHKPDGAERR